MTVRSADALLDANTVILLPRLSPGFALPDQSAISTITLAELAVGPVVTDQPEAQLQRQAELMAALESFRVIPFDQAAAFAYPAVVKSLLDGEPASLLVSSRL